MNESGKIETNDEFDDSPAYAVMRVLEKLGNLTIEDKMLIFRIMIGTSKLVTSKLNVPPEIEAKGSCKNSRKDLLFLSVASKVVLQTASPEKFRALNIRDLLPDNIKNVHASQISRMFNSLVGLGVIVKSDKSKLRRRGKQSPISNNDYSGERGVKSYYKQSDCHQKVLLLLSKPYVAALLYSFLLESNLLYRYLYYTNLEMLHMVRLRRESFSEINTAMFEDSTDSIADSLYKGLLKLGDDKIEILVRKTMGVILQKIKMDSPILKNLYIWGAIFYSS